ncbi:MAG: ParB/Srx family N-terminal domain-containing protein, partial [Novosphingobium sp.]|nr:ParB/Srx family N-terminal domain-containing protein [Novosphingobium sp.]
MTLAFAPDRIETWPLERLRPYARNAKQHGSDQVARIAASMAAFGWTVPCLVAEDGELIAGHGRVLAAMELGLTEAPGVTLVSTFPRVCSGSGAEVRYSHFG